VRKVWDGWSDDALIASPLSGVWADGDRLHPPAHRGEHYAVAGILPLPRSPQGHPVLAQAGSSDDGVDLAARHADVVFTPQASMANAVAFRARLHDAVRRHGRDPAHVRTWPGLSFVLGSTQAEADAAWAALEGAASEEFRLRNLTHIAGVPPAVAEAIDPDGPFPYEVFEHAASTTFGAAVVRTARQHGLTFRQAAHRFATLPGGLHLTGPPEALADLITTWFQAGAADGFTLQPLRLPVDLVLFVDHVVPLLRARGIAAPEYRPGTLRDRLGLPRPPGHR
jgi:alkanesulfonate monooxygenase SsuD/methylene tetrahydromethanopterin reductase-like flavin-dependent oxidoreductase (luciferase family)